MTEILDRTSIQRNLETFINGEQTPRQFDAWLKTAIIGNRVTIPVPEEELIHDLLMSIDYALTFSESAVDLKYILALLQQVRPNERVRELLPITHSVPRLAEILRRNANGIISRTSFLSVIAERRWPPSIKRHMEKLGAAELRALEQALTTANFARVESLLCS